MKNRLNFKIAKPLSSNNRRIIIDNMSYILDIGCSKCSQKTSYWNKIKISKLPIDYSCERNIFLLRNEETNTLEEVRIDLPVKDRLLKLCINKENDLPCNSQCSLAHSNVELAFWKEEKNGKNLISDLSANLKSNFFYLDRKSSFYCFYIIFINTVKSNKSSVTLDKTFAAITKVNNEKHQNSIKHRDNYKRDANNSSFGLLIPLNGSYDLEPYPAYFNCLKIDGHNFIWSIACLDCWKSRSRSLYVDHECQKDCLIVKKYQTTKAR